MKHPHASRSALFFLLAALLISGCKQNDAVTQADKADKVNGVAVPTVEETRQIAEQGFIYGLPIVMNYTANYEFFLDPTSSQYKGPNNKLVNEARS